MTGVFVCRLIKVTFIAAPLPYIDKYLYLYSFDILLLRHVRTNLVRNLLDEWALRVVFSLCFIVFIVCLVVTWWWVYFYPSQGKFWNVVMVMVYAFSLLSLDSTVLSHCLIAYYIVSILFIIHLLSDEDTAVGSNPARDFDF